MNLESTNELTTCVTEGPKFLTIHTFPMKSFKYNSNKKIEFSRQTFQHNLQKQI